MAALTAFTQLGATTTSVGPVDPGPALKLTRWGFAAKQTVGDDLGKPGDADGPAWSDTTAPITTSAGLAGKIKVKRVYLQPGQKFASATDDLLELAAMGGICVISVKWTTQAEYTQGRADMQAFAAAHPNIFYIFAAHHEPKTNNAYTPTTWMPIQRMAIAACLGIAQALFSLIYNGYFWATASANRKAMMAEGGFPAWCPDWLFQAVLDQNGLLMMDAYPGGNVARPGNNPPTPETPGEGAGARIDNFGLWSSGKPFQDDKGNLIPGSTTVMPRLGCGEISAFRVDHMLDAMAKAAKWLIVACWWNHRADGAALETNSPANIAGNGGNPNSTLWKTEYVKQHDRVQAAGGPPPIQAAA